MALPPSTANWHWKNKNITRWGKEWFERELTTLSVTGDNENEVVSISKVTDVDGDIELGQRKSKWVEVTSDYYYSKSLYFSNCLTFLSNYDPFRLITIFDCKVVLKWTGSASDGTEVKGTLTIPEVSHEIICDKLSDFVVSEIRPLSRHVTRECSLWYLTCSTSTIGPLRQTHHLKSMPYSRSLNCVCRKY